MKKIGSLLCLFCILSFISVITLAQVRSKTKRKRSVKTKQSASVTSNNYPQNETLKLSRRMFSVPTSRIMWFPIPLGQTHVFGRFEVGDNSNIYMWIMDDDELTNFRNGNSFRSYYTSGSRTVDNFDARIPNNRQHYLVFNNKNIFTNKIVTLDVNFAQ